MHARHSTKINENTEDIEGLRASSEGVRATLATLCGNMHAESAARKALEHRIAEMQRVAEQQCWSTSPLWHAPPGASRSTSHSYAPYNPLSDVDRPLLTTTRLVAAQKAEEDAAMAQALGSPFSSPLATRRVSSPGTEPLGDAVSSDPNPNSNPLTLTLTLAPTLTLT